MKRKLNSIINIVILLLIMYFSIIPSCYAQKINQNTSKVQISTNETEANLPDFTIYSEAAILIDSKTGKIICGKNVHEKMYPASVTKILTAIIAIENCEPTDMLTASRNAVMSIPSGYSNAAIQPNESVVFKDLLDMFLIHSANEIGYIFAEHISRSVENFATLMNEKAKELGCLNTHFTNPSGIHDKDHYTTAYDMALITKYCMKNETFRKVVSTKSCVIEPTEKFDEKRYYNNTNDLIDKSSRYYYEYAIGVKTGFTSQAKNCLIAASLKDDIELITVALGAEATEDGRSGRYVDSINLFNYGYENYKMQKIAEKNTKIDEIVIENANKETKNLPLLLENSINALTPNTFNKTQLKPSITLTENLTAPISENTVVGTITYEIDGVTYTTNLLAGHNVIEKENILKIIIQIILVIFILFILYRIFKTKNKKKKKTKKSKKVKNTTNRKKNSDSIYKF